MAAVATALVPKRKCTPFEFKVHQRDSGCLQFDHDRKASTWLQKSTNLESALSWKQDSTSTMSSQTSLFQVYLRLRPPIRAQPPTHHVEPWLLVEPASLQTSQNEDSAASFPTHITLQPPNDSRKRAIERFGFTKIFQENATQLDVFEETGTADSIRNVLQSGRDGLVATLGVTGSGKVGFKLGEGFNG